MTGSLATEHNPQSLSTAKHFRIIMDAMARPGTLRTVAGDIGAVGPLNRAAAMIALTLCDHETPVWFDPALATNEVVEFIRFQCGSPIRQAPDDASFAFFATCPTSETLDRLALGTPAYPDRSATVIMQSASLKNAGDRVLSGPGIKAPLAFEADGVSETFWEWWDRNTARFPLGIDVLFASDQALSALPRTARAKETA